jgi:hypothetical protein
LRTAKENKHIKDWKKKRKREGGGEKIKNFLEKTH